MLGVFQNKIRLFRKNEQETNKLNDAFHIKKK